MFDEELEKLGDGGRKNQFTDHWYDVALFTDGWEEGLFTVQCCHDCFLVSARSDSSDDEIDDKALNNILIVTQTPPYLKKHPQGDRHPNPDYVPRSKMTADLAKMINDELCNYEEELWTDQEVETHCSSHDCLALTTLYFMYYQQLLLSDYMH